MQLYTQAQRSGASAGRVDEVVSAIEDLLVECPLFTVSFLVSKICIFVCCMLLHKCVCFHMPKKASGLWSFSI